MRPAVPSSPGTYALLLSCVRVGRVAVGSLGSMSIGPGAYLYIGSAFGPGGLRARLARHAACKKPTRWHVDYIRPHMRLAGAWFSTAPEPLEHDWASGILALESAAIPLPRFGASDCQCSSHLISFEDSASTRDAVAVALGAASPHEPNCVVPARLRRLARRPSPKQG